MNAADEILESKLEDDELEACLGYQLEAWLQERAGAVLDGWCPSVLLDFVPHHLAGTRLDPERIMRAAERVVRRVAALLEESGIILSVCTRVGDGLVLSVSNSSALA